MMLDPNTLLTAAVITRIVMTATLLIAGLFSRSNYMVCWSFNPLLALIGFLMQVFVGTDLQHYPGLIFVTYLVHGLSLNCIWIGLRLFDDLRIDWRIVFSLVIFPAVLNLVLKWVGFSPNDAKGLTFFAYLIIDTMGLITVINAMRRGFLLPYCYVVAALTLQMAGWIMLLAETIFLGDGAKPWTMSNVYLVADQGMILLLSMGLLTLDGERMRKAIARQANTDALTGLNNRHGIINLLKRPRKQTQFGTVLIADIDFFKRINDQHGHDAGDAVLAEFGRRMKTAFRRVTDLTGRWGGEEFLAVLLDTPFERAIERAEVLRGLVEAEPFLTAKASLSVTVSIGLAPIADNINNGMDHVIKLADEALYEAKRMGRNRIVPSSPKTNAEADAIIESGSSKVRRPSTATSITSPSRSNSQR